MKWQDWIFGYLFVKITSQTFCIMKNRWITQILFLVITISFSCVSSRQFNDVQEKSQKLQDERDMLKAENHRLTVSNTENSSKIKAIGEELDILKREAGIKEEEYESLNKTYQLLKRGYNDLKQAQEELARGNDRETRRLLKQLQITQEDLQLREDELRKLEQSVNEKKRNLEEMQYEVEKRNERLLELETALKQKDAMMAELKNKVSTALLGFENNGLTITQKNGKVYVSMDEKLLFQTGSYTVDSRGIEAIKNLGKVLEQNRDIQVLVEGHTDNVPYRSGGGHIQDNWDLSVKRATSIVRILLESSSIDPERVTAAGRGEFFPVDLANTTEARQKNRRTEIILIPDMDKLYNILDSY